MIVTEKMTVTYLKNIYHILSTELENLLHVSRDSHGMGYINSSIQHPKNLHKLLILNDVEWAVSTCTPHGKEISKTCSGIGHAIAKRRYLLCRWRIGRIAVAFVIQKVFG
jgi:hypothetical protein